MSTARAGRRPGNPDTRAEIVAAAGREFAERGYDGTSMRAVARAAGVDARLVHHYFDSKEQLLLEALGSQIDPRLVITGALNGPQDERAERLARGFLNAWEEPEVRQPLLAVIRAAATSEAASRLTREGLFTVVSQALRPHLHGEDVETRLGLIASQMIGLAYLRYVVELEPLASTPADELVPHLAAAVAAYLD